MNIGKEEADAMDGTLIDAYMIALDELNKDGEGGGKAENDLLRKSLMG